jgi:UDP-3-O-[3-hydroxymyristoyl] glucosamine N-acyltransferase
MTVQLSYIINQLVSLGVQVDLVGSGQTEIQQVAGLDHADSNHISFLNDKKYIHALQETQAGAVILSAAYSENCSVPHLIVDNPYYVYALVAQLLNPKTIGSGVHCDASVDTSAQLAKHVCVKAQAVVHAGVMIAQSTLIGSGAVIEENVQIGANCRIGSNVVICHDCVIGDDVIIEAGSVIGGDGFGWANHQGRWIKIPQVGRVIIGSHVSIGNNVCIDRGAIEDTVIADNCIIDNLVHIAHNVKIGEGSAIAGQVGFAGSTTLGAHCTVAGQVGFAGHLTIADNIHFLAKAGVTHNLDKPGAYAGFPAIPVSDWQKNSVRARNLDKMSKQIKQLQKQLDALTN